MDKLIIISAPSGAGKTTLVKFILEEFSQLKFSISCTTRLKRENEKNNLDYIFLSIDEFKNKINNDEFVEWEEVYPDKFYGTLKSELNKIWLENKIPIFDVDVEGGLKLKQKYNQSLSIFIAPPSIDELRKRLINRDTDSFDNIKIRVKKAEEEILLAKYFDIILINDDLLNSKNELKQIIVKYISD